jgi:hypothetical protein
MKSESTLSPDQQAALQAARREETKKKRIEGLYKKILEKKLQLDAQNLSTGLSAGDVFFLMAGEQKLSLGFENAAENGEKIFFIRLDPVNDLYRIYFTQAGKYYIAPNQRLGKAEQETIKKDLLTDQLKKSIKEEFSKYLNAEIKTIEELAANKAQKQIETLDAELEKLRNKGPARQSEAAAILTQSASDQSAFDQSASDQSAFERLMQRLEKEKSELQEEAKIVYERLYNRSAGRTESNAEQQRLEGFIKGISEKAGEEAQKIKNLAALFEERSEEVPPQTISDTAEPVTTGSIDEASWELLKLALTDEEKRQYDTIDGEIEVSSSLLSHSRLASDTKLGALDRNITAIKSQIAAKIAELESFNQDSKAELESFNQDSKKESDELSQDTVSLEYLGRLNEVYLKRVEEIQNRKRQAKQKAIENLKNKLQQTQDNKDSLSALKEQKIAAEKSLQDDLQQARQAFVAQIRRGNTPQLSSYRYSYETIQKQQQEELRKFTQEDQAENSPKVQDIRELEAELKKLEQESQNSVAAAETEMAITKEERQELEERIKRFISIERRSGTSQDKIEEGVEKFFIQPGIKAIEIRKKLEDTLKKVKEILEAEKENNKKLQAIKENPVFDKNFQLAAGNDSAHPGHEELQKKKKEFKERIEFFKQKRTQFALLSRLEVSLNQELTNLGYALRSAELSAELTRLEGFIEQAEKQITDYNDSRENDNREINAGIAENADVIKELQQRAAKVTEENEEMRQRLSADQKEIATIKTKIQKSEKENAERLKRLGAIEQIAATDFASVTADVSSDYRDLQLQKQQFDLNIAFFKEEQQKLKSDSDRLGNLNYQIDADLEHLNSFDQVRQEKLKRKEMSGRIEELEKLKTPYDESRRTYDKEAAKRLKENDDFVKKLQELKRDAEEKKRKEQQKTDQNLETEAQKQARLQRIKEAQKQKDEANKNRAEEDRKKKEQQQPGQNPEAKTEAQKQAELLQKIQRDIEDVAKNRKDVAEQLLQKFAKAKEEKERQQSDQNPETEEEKQDKLQKIQRDRQQAVLKELSEEFAKKKKEQQQKDKLAKDEADKKKAEEEEERKKKEQEKKDKLAKEQADKNKAEADKKKAEEEEKKKKEQEEKDKLAKKKTEPDSDAEKNDFQDKNNYDKEENKSFKEKTVSFIENARWPIAVGLLFVPGGGIILAAAFLAATVAFNKYALGSDKIREQRDAANKEKSEAKAGLENVGNDYEKYLTKGGANPQTATGGANPQMPHNEDEELKKIIESLKNNGTEPNGSSPKIPSHSGQATRGR